MVTVVRSPRQSAFRRVSVLACAFTGLFLLAGGTDVNAQSTWPLHVGVVGGAVDYDLGGTGVTPGIAIRGTRAVTPHLEVEVGSLFASPRQQSGSSTLVIPEAQLKYHWTMGRVSPFVGGGGGASFDSGSANWRTRPTLSFSTGALVRMNNRLAVVGELRGRGIERTFSASTAEWLGGLRLRLD